MVYPHPRSTPSHEDGSEENSGTCILPAGHRRRLRGCSDYSGAWPSDKGMAKAVPSFNAISQDQAVAVLAEGASQATAYVMVFVHFKNNREAVCTYLVISDSTLAKRVTFAADTVRVQPSLFDRIERIESSFMPPPGKQYAAKPVQAGAGTQWRWEFE